MDTDVSKQGQGPQSQETLPRKESLETETSCQKRVIRSQELSASELSGRREKSQCSGSRNGQADYSRKQR